MTQLVVDQLLNETQLSDEELDLLLDESGRSIFLSSPRKERERETHSSLMQVGLAVDKDLEAMLALSPTPSSPDKKPGE